VVVALSLQAVQSVSKRRLDRLGPLYERLLEDDVSFMADVVNVLHHGGESRFVTSADLKLHEDRVRKLMWMVQCLEDTTWPEESIAKTAWMLKPPGPKHHMNDAHSEVTKKPALLETISHAGQANDMLLNRRLLDHLGQMIDAPKYPFDPAMDGDFIVDAKNYLEDFINASDIPKKLKDQYTTSSTTTMTTATTSTITKAKAATTPAKNATATSSTAKPNMTTPAPKKMSLLGGRCTTLADKSSERRWQFLFGLNIAASGTPCLFGVVPDDEGSHCILSDGKYGKFGWCYTRSDRTEWGSCAEGCPLVSSADAMAKRLDRLTLRVNSALNNLGMTKCSHTRVS